MFRGLDPTDESSRAQLKAVLVSVGEVCDMEWAGMKGMVDQPMIKRLMAMDPQISAANAFRKVLEAKLVAANAALMRTFPGEHSSILTELRSYRVPPPLTLSVLQATLMLCGHGDDESLRWGKMKLLTSYKLVKMLTTLRPASIPRMVSPGSQSYDLSRTHTRTHGRARVHAHPPIHPLLAI
ncbi:MAG: hypothetical protein WDW38_003474 [Sanguina aurantia]